MLTYSFVSKPLLLPYFLEISSWIRNLITFRPFFLLFLMMGGNGVGWQWQEDFTGDAVYFLLHHTRRCTVSHCLKLFIQLSIIKFFNSLSLDSSSHRWSWLRSFVSRGVTKWWHSNSINIIPFIFISWNSSIEEISLINYLIHWHAIDAGYIFDYLPLLFFKAFLVLLVITFADW